jgi:hypothetical protein
MERERLFLSDWEVKIMVRKLVKGSIYNYIKLVLLQGSGLTGADPPSLQGLRDLPV